MYSVWRLGTSSADCSASGKVHGKLTQAPRPLITCTTTTHYNSRPKSKHALVHQDGRSDADLGPRKGAEVPGKDRAGLAGCSVGFGRVFVGRWDVMGRAGLLSSCVVILKLAGSTRLRQGVGNGV